ncbi:hypothetical protein JAAARDRAFT_204138 [Jaapia argillacea MUCL 33604]|uniref:Uncharacterized protein n=1 Tax=Jaapia argillacea MUCL 33604 TaxID=933084 RepID=A0A067QDV2_9AGAM|nr:hypothetical protein JAAARDRAFT_204138 [Jaapia argillacea MUCL 33604]
MLPRHLKTMEESDGMRAISRASAAVSTTVSSATEPIRNTAAYKILADTVIDALDDNGSAKLKHAGFEEKEAQRKRRALRLLWCNRWNHVSHPQSTTLSIDSFAPY